MIRQSTILAIWLLILIIELFSFYDLIHSVHSQDETLFQFTIILVTLVVGAVLLNTLKNQSR